MSQHRKLPAAFTTVLASALALSIAAPAAASPYGHVFRNMAQEPVSGEVQPTPTPAPGPAPVAQPYANPQPYPGPQPYAEPQPYPPAYPGPAPAAEAPRSRRKGLMIGGWTMLGASYLFTALVGAIISDSKTICEDPARCQRLGYYMMIPVAGPFIATGPSNTATGSIFLGLVGVVQTAGLIMGIAGTAQFVADGRRNQTVMNNDGFRLTRRGLRVNASPTTRGGAMVMLNYRF